MSSLQRSEGLVREAGGPELLERLMHLDQSRQAGGRPPPETGPSSPSPGTQLDFDVVVAGGGLWSLLSPVLARRGLRVAVLDRARVAQSHREWNASGPELRALVDAGLTSADALSSLVLAKYDSGVCRFFGGARAHPVTGVLDHAVDAGALLAHGRALAEGLGVTILDRHAVTSHATGKDAVRVRTRTAAGTRDLVTRVLVDARGAASPYATGDLVCPTVGGVVTGLAPGTGDGEMDCRVGEILVTIDGIDAGRQHVWEAFPGRAGETTVYLFFYARTGEPVRLADLYARFFETLPSYKRGEARLLRPTFGFIPGWSRLSPAPRAPDARVVLVGDAAARHSPLTCCGFGATLRSLVRTADAVERLVVGEPPAALGACVVDDAPAHALTGILADVMAARTFRGGELNSLLDAAFTSLSEMDGDAYGKLLRDEMSPAGVIKFIRKTAARHPQVWGHVMRALGPWAAARWAFRAARLCA